MRWRSSVALFLVAALASPSWAQPQPRQTLLQRDVDAILADPALARSTWGVVVKSLKTDRTIYAVNPHKLLMPASVMKVVTVATAVDRLGWDFAYDTQIIAAGSVENGVLDGDLVVVGSGDPAIVERDGMASQLFADWAERLKAGGISAIAGRIVGDDDVFDDEPLGFGWSWDDLGDGFAAGASGLQYNENRVVLTVSPGAASGTPAQVSVSPTTGGLVVVNLVTTGPERTVSVRRLAGSARVEVRGSVPPKSEPITVSVSVDNPTLFFVSALRDALVAHGIDVRGPAVDIDDINDRPSRDGRPVVVDYRSPPLSTLLVGPMKFSVNLYEETLLKTASTPTTGSTAESGRKATRATLDRWGIPAGEMIQMDGSGLSRYDYVTADATVDVLSHVYGDPRLRTRFEELLPIAGRDGTLSNRFKGTSLEGKLRAKTGSMSNVRSLAGYLTTAAGEPIAFAIIANNFETPGDVVTHAIDRIALRLAQ